MWGEFFSGNEKIYYIFIVLGAVDVLT